jgi:3-oxoadipate enol-lactonase
MSTCFIHGVAVEVEGSGEPVICIHGLGGSSNLWTPVMAGISRYRMIRIDLPFSARSPGQGAIRDMQSLTQCVRAVIEVLAIEHAHFMGHSMGALVCFELARQWPALVNSMALFAPLRATAESSRAALRARADAARSGGTAGMADIADQVVNHTTAAETRRIRPVAAAYIRESIMRQPAAGYAAMCDILAGAGAVCVDRVECPVMLVGGDEDPVAPPDAVREIGALLAQPRLRTLRNCGHWPTVERPHDCITELGDFWRDQAVPAHQ